MRKLFIIIPVFSFFLLPSIGHAQLDPRCFTEAECIDRRTKQIIQNSVGPQNVSKEAAEGWVAPNTETISACGETDSEDRKLGFCLPAGKTVTEITFGGRNTFLHLGDFIQYVFRYAIVLAGILATFVLIKSGFKWMISAGGDGISSAKESIGNALIGLTIAVGSYFILNLVNPYLVHLRLPQVWLIKEQNEVPALCTQLKPGYKLAEAKKQGEQKSSADMEKKLTESQFGLTGQNAPCGADYFVQGQGTQTCQGTFCPEQGGTAYVCAPSAGNPKLSSCQPGSIAGMIVNSSVTADTPLNSLITEDWDWPWVGSAGEDIEITRVCTDGTFEDIGSGTEAKNELNPRQHYILLVSGATINEAETACKTKGGLKGFVLNIEFNEQLNLEISETHYIGIAGGRGVDLGDHPAFLKIAKSAPLEYFIQPDALRHGVVLNIDAGLVADIDASTEREQRNAQYGRFGYQF